MINLGGILKRIVTAFLLIVAFSLPGRAQEDLDDLFALLAQPGLAGWEEVEEKIRVEWSRSGSASMNLLLERGRDALEAGEYQAALDHFSALTDHAPDFAEAWNARATALFQIGAYGPALADIRRALSLNPRHFGAMLGMGIILEDIGEEQAALAAYEAAHAIHPNRPDLEDAVNRLKAQLEGLDI